MIVCVCFFIMLSEVVTRALPRVFRLFLIPPKDPFLNQATQKNACQICSPKKLLDSKVSNPKKSFDHRCHLPPLGNPLQATSGARFCKISIVSVPPHFNQPGHSITDKELILFELQPKLSMSRRKAREAYLINRG